MEPGTTAFMMTLVNFYLEMRSDSEQRITSVHLKNREPLDREEQGFYQLTLIASEGNVNPNTTNLTDECDCHACLR